MLGERALVVRLVAVVVEMVGLGVRHDGDGWAVFAEAAVGFVRLRHEHVARAGVAAVEHGAVRALDRAADGVARVGERAFAAMEQDVREHRACGGLAVCAGHGHGACAVHEQGENVAAVHDVRALCLCLHDFGVAGLDGARVDDDARALHIAGALPDFDGDAERFEAVGLRAALTVGTVDGHMVLVEHLGEHAHARSPDADEMGAAQTGHGLLLVELCGGGVERHCLCVMRATHVNSSSIVSAVLCRSCYRIACGVCRGHLHQRASPAMVRMRCAMRSAASRMPYCHALRP